MLFTNKNSLTLLVVTTGEVLRIDGVKGSKPVIHNLARERRPENLPLASAVEMALGLSTKRPSARTVVLAEELWTGVLDVDQRSVQGLGGEELEQMLRFEAESLSGLDPMTSHLQVVEAAPTGTDSRRYWCVGVAAEVLPALTAAVELRGGKLTQLGHPLGWTGPAGDGAWSEFRRSVAGAFSTSPVAGALPRVAIATRGGASERWYRGLEAVFGNAFPTVGWVEGDVAAPAACPAQLTPLASDEGLHRWASGVLEKLAGVVTPPLIKPPAPPVSTRALASIGMAAVLVALLGCGGHFLSVTWMATSLRAEIEALKQPGEEKKLLESQIRDLTQQIAKANTERDALQQQSEALALVTARRDRFAELLRLVAHARDEDLIVDQIVAETNGLRLTGRAIDNDAAVQLAVRLSPQLGALGWRVHTPEVDGENKLDNGGPWAFRIDLVDTALAPKAPPPAPDTITRQGSDSTERPINPAAASTRFTAAD